MDVQLTQIDCCNCGISFWISSQRQRELVDTKQSFYCPNGHGQAYTTNEKDRLNEIIRQKSSTITDLYIKVQQLEENCKKKSRKKKKK